MIKDDRDTNLQILNDQNGVPNSNEIEIFHPPPPPDNPESDSDETNSHGDNQDVHENGNGDESDSDENNSHGEVNEDDSEDQEHYMVYQEENNGIENNIHLPQIPIINYAGDVEHEEDFGNDWEWTEKDPGPSCGPFTSQPGLRVLYLIYFFFIFLYKICSETFFLLFPSYTQCSKTFCYIVGLGLNCKFIDLLFKHSVINFIEISSLVGFIVSEIIYSQTDTLTEELMDLR